MLISLMRAETMRTMVKVLFRRETRKELFQNNANRNYELVVIVPP
jgi:hypothetical protein